MIRRFRDKTLSRCTAYLFNAKIRKFGTLLSFDLDSVNRTIEMEIMLRGEEQALHISIRNYKITEEEGKSFLAAEEIKSSKEWIDMLVQTYGGELKLEIPARYAKIAEMLT